MQGHLFCLVLTRNKAAAISPEPVYELALHETGDGSRIFMTDDLAAPLFFKLPVTDPDKTDPQHFESSLWSGSAISDVSQTNGSVSFNSVRFGFFTLLEPTEDPDNYTPSKKSSSNCFIHSLQKNADD